MFFRISHGEQNALVRLRSELVVPIGLAETAADAMNRGETLEITDSDFIGRDPDDASVSRV